MKKHNNKFIVDCRDSRDVLLTMDWVYDRSFPDWPILVYINRKDRIIRIDDVEWFFAYDDKDYVGRRHYQEQSKAKFIEKILEIDKVLREFRKEKENERH